MSGRNPTFDPTHQHLSSSGFNNIWDNSYVKIGIYFIVAILIVCIILILIKKYTTLLDNNRVGNFLGSYLPFFSKATSKSAQ